MVQALPQERPDALLPMPLRLWVSVAALLSGSMALILGFHVAGTSTPSCVDTWIRSEVHNRLSGAPNLTLAVVHAGDPLPMLVMTALLAALCVLLRCPFHAILALIAPATVGGATMLFKPAIGRIFHGDLAFPSGHTAGVTALALVAGLLLVNMAHTHLAVAVSVATAMVLLAGASIGFALVAMDWHYPTDAVGGFCTAITIVIALASLLDRFRVAMGRRRVPVR
jgi:membrane-associated phospholipid phosphatase